ncbi:MAG TPA: hypothetical protein VGK73_35520 [Polyangiaceae bacterium]
MGFCVLAGCSGGEENGEERGLENEAAGSAGKGSAGTGGTGIIITGGSAGAGGISGSAGSFSSGGFLTEAGSGGSVESGGAGGRAGGGGSAGTPLTCDGDQIGCNGVCMAPGDPMTDGCRAVHKEVGRNVTDIETAGDDYFYSVSGTITGGAADGTESVIFTTEAYVKEIEVTDEFVYALTTEAGEGEEIITKIQRLPRAGGAEPELIAELVDQGTTENMQIIGDEIYFLLGSSFDSELMSVPIAGGELRASGYDSLAYASSGGELFFYGNLPGEPSGSFLHAVPPLPFAAPPVEIGQATSMSVYLHAYEGYLYYANLQGLARMPLTGGTEEIVEAVSLTSVRAFAGSEAFVTETGLIDSMALTDGTRTRLATTAGFYPTKFAATATRVYAADLYALVEIQR